MIEICENRFLGDFGNALSDFGIPLEYTNDAEAEPYSPIGEQLYAQMLGLDECWDGKGAFVRGRV